MRLQVRYIHILTLLLTVLIATPCSIKKMYADFAGVEAPQKNGAGSAKLHCQAFVTDAEEHKVEKSTGVYYRVKTFSYNTLHDDNAILTSPVFLLLKEKIPSYLLYRTLLI